MAKLVQTGDGVWVEKGRQHVTTHDENGHISSHVLPEAPPTLEQRVFIAVAQSGRAVTRREIAKALGLKSTGWLNGKIDGMVNDGLLCRDHGTHYNGVVKFLYRVANNK